MSECRVADTTGDRRVQATIMLARLIRKAKEAEKDESARDKRPTVCLDAAGVLPPNDAWDLDDMGKVAVREGPSFPRFDTCLRIDDDKIRPQRNGPK